MWPTRPGVAEETGLNDHSAGCAEISMIASKATKIHEAVMKRATMILLVLALVPVHGFAGQQLIPAGSLIQ